MSQPISASTPQSGSRAQSPWLVLYKNFIKDRLAAFALVVLVCVCLVALFAPWLSPQDPYDLGQVTVLNSELPPGSLDATNSQRFILGTDAAGRDLLSAIFYGLRISIGVGVASALIAMLFGTALGLIAAHFGGRTDAAIMRLVDLQLSFPALLVALTLLATLGPGVDKTLLALIVVQWAYYARGVRGSAMVERRKEYVEAAIGQGLPAWRLMFRHVLPNCLAPLLVIATLQTAHAITLEATMSFLGIGLPPTKPSLGLLIANGFTYLMTNKFWISVYPGLALVVLVGSINLVGDRLRVVLNPKSGG